MEYQVRQVILRIFRAAAAGLHTGLRIFPIRCPCAVPRDIFAVPEIAGPHHRTALLLPVNSRHTPKYSSFHSRFRRCGSRTGAVFAVHDFY